MTRKKLTHETTGKWNREIEIELPDEARKMLLEELNVNKRINLWEPWEVEVLKKYRKNLTYEQMAKILKRSHQSIRGKISLLRIKGEIND
jgi:hypothetical protein